MGAQGGQNPSFCRFPTVTFFVVSPRGRLFGVFGKPSKRTVQACMGHGGGVGVCQQSLFNQQYGPGFMAHVQDFHPSFGHTLRFSPFQPPQNLRCGVNTLKIGRRVLTTPSRRPWGPGCSRLRLDYPTNPNRRSTQTKSMAG